VADNLVEGALPWSFVRPPAQKLRAARESTRAEVSVSDLGDEIRLEWSPFFETFGARAAQAARSIACEARLAPKPFQFLDQSSPNSVVDRGREPDMVQRSVFVIKLK
jgi:hypothetical protein